MRVVERTGRTIDDAVQEALRHLGVQRDEVDVEVLEEPSRGLFGLLGSRRARVRVRLKPGVEPGRPDDGADEIDYIAPLQGALDTGLDEGPRQQEARDEQPETDAAAPAARAHTERTPPATAPEPSAEEEQPDEQHLHEEKIEMAQQFLAGVLERMEVDAALEMRIDEDEVVHLNIAGDELGLVIGRRGQTLDALQFLTNQVTNKLGGPRMRIVLDAEGYRARRAEALASLGRRMARRVRRDGREVSLEPMNAFERRIVHITLAEEDDVQTYSEGRDPHRRVIIAPASSRRSNG